MRANPVIACSIVAAGLAFAITHGRVDAQDSTQELAAAPQNPVAAMYSLPFQNNIYGGAGPNHDATANVLKIRPVIPITVGDWNIISRTIAPLVYLPSIITGPFEITEQSLFSGFNFGLGDINQSFYFSPKADGLIWASVLLLICRLRQPRHWALPISAVTA